MQPVDRQESKSFRLPSPFDDGLHNLVNDLRTLVEYRMKVLSGKIRAKQNWWKKVHDAEIVARWRTEMREQDQILVNELWSGDEYWYWMQPTPELLQDYQSSKEEYTQDMYPSDGYRFPGTPKPWPREPVSSLQLDHIFDELVYDAGRVDEATGAYPTSIYGVYASYTLIHATLTDSLLAGVAILEDVPEEEKDWHPGSDKLVLDLVHPSLYPLRIEHSALACQSTVNNSNAPKLLTGEVYRAYRPDLDAYDYVVSRAFQWLPTDFQLSTDGDGHTAMPLGYINNLRPTRHRALYSTISSILARFVPLWERVLTDVTNPAPPPAIDADPYKWYDKVPKSPSWQDTEAYDKWQREDKWPFIPEPAQFTPPEARDRVEVTLGGRTLQVIVKLANIVLTPENPVYPGGSWHVEGMANEKIVATGLYYYAVENISESRLDFRCVVGDEEATVEFAYQQNDSKGYSIAFGFGGDDPLNQNLGSIVAQEGKCVAFPNVYQHHVDKFELVDKKKPGHRKILCFFLVDPNTRILSTSDISPQQEDWLEDDAARFDGMQNLPQELYDLIIDHARLGVMTRQEAEEVRQKLMAERKAFVVAHNEQVFEYKFDMCEH